MELIERPCNRRGPNGYRCTESVDAASGFRHKGQRHVARAIVGDELGSAIVDWTERDLDARWNLHYRGR